MLARSGVPVTLIARERNVEAIRKNGLFIDGLKIREHIAVDATSDDREAGNADIVLFSVKTTDTESGAKTLAASRKANATVVSLQNGIDNVERIRAASGIDAIPAVVYVGVAMVAPGHVKHSGAGNLVLGHAPRSAEICALFEQAEVPCRLSDQIDVELWEKFMLNLAYNAISALTQATYGRIAEDSRSRAVVELAVHEVVRVANARGVPLDTHKMIEKAIGLSKIIPQATSSTAQDIARGARTEIDSLNGYLFKLGQQLGIPVPVNETLYALVKLRETTSSSP